MEGSQKFTVSREPFGESHLHIQVLLTSFVKANTTRKLSGPRGNFQNPTQERGGEPPLPEAGTTRPQPQRVGLTCKRRGLGRPILAAACGKGYLHHLFERSARD
eukprot:6435160-Amphidinium_carterae.1